jgi:opacity protein-like surface antigen
VNKLLKTLLMGAVIAGGWGSVVTAADAPDPVLGTWKLDTARSKFTPGPAPKSQTRTYAETAQGTAMTFTGVAANGSSMSGQSTFKYDGKDYKITGSADYDTLSLKRLNGSTVRADLKKGGKVVGTTVRTLTGHGKVLTLASKGTGATGAPFDIVMVFDKQ